MNRYTWRTALGEGGAWIIALIFLLPVYILVNMAIRPATDLSSPIAPTSSPTLSNFARAWNEASLGAAIGNSAAVTVASVALLSVSAALAAYGLTRLTSTWSSAAFYLFMIGLLVPFQLGLIPLYQFMRTLNLIGGLLPLILIYWGTRLPFSIFLYVQFMRTIPHEYEEAARIDGAGHLRTFWSVIFPLVAPITGTVLILNGLFVWNDFLTPLLYLSGTTSQTVPVAIYSFIGEYGTEWQLVFAALIMAATPLLVVYFFIQKTLIRGLASGIKG